MGDRDLPGRTGLHGEQVGRAFDQRDVGADPNQPVAEMRVGAASLFHQAMEQTRMAMCVSDPHRADTPIVFVNQAFVEMTGYPREEVLGRNCRFLQGADTAPTQVARIREALERREVAVVEILNYRRDGTPFWNALHVGPIFGPDGRLTHFYGSQWDVTALVEERRRSHLDRQVASELRHRTSNLFVVIDAIVSLSARGAGDAGALAETISERIRALGRAHRASLDPHAAGERCLLGDLVVAILEPYRMQGAGRLELMGPEVVLPDPLVTPLGLALHELATNATKYGALGAVEGRLSVAWRREGADALVLEWTEEGGPAVRAGPGGAPTTRGTGTGTRILHGVLSGAGASVETDWRPGGLHAVLRAALR